MNIGADLFETQVNFTKYIPTSVSTTIRKFLYNLLSSVFKKASSNIIYTKLEREYY